MCKYRFLIFVLLYQFVEKVLIISFIEKVRTTWGIARCSKPCSTISLICENRFNLFWFRTIGNPAFQALVTSEKDNFPKFLIQYQTSHGLFCKQICKVIFFWCYESLKCRVAYGMKSKLSKSIFVIKENSSIRFRAPFYYLKKFSLF